MLELAAEPSPVATFVRHTGYLDSLARFYATRVGSHAISVLRQVFVGSDIYCIFLTAWELLFSPAAALVNAV